MKKILIIGIILISIIIAVVLVVYWGIRAEGDYVRLGLLRENVARVIDALALWAGDNDGMYPVNPNVQSMKGGKPFTAYFEKPIVQPYTEGYTKLDSMITFVGSEVPAKLEYGQHKPGSIEVYVFGDGKGCVVVGYGYKKQPIIRTDSDEFKKFYDAYLKMIKPNR
mgnify:CR=1 FL=1